MSGLDYSGWDEQDTSLGFRRFMDGRTWLAFMALTNVVLYQVMSIESNARTQARLFLDHAMMRSGHSVLCIPNLAIAFSTSSTALATTSEPEALPDRTTAVHYSSSSSPSSPSSFFSAAFAFFLLTRPGRPPP